MAYKSLHGSTGYLVVGLTPVRITDNLAGFLPGFIAGNRYAAHTIKIQQHESNTGYLCLCHLENGQVVGDISISTGVGVMDKLIPPFTSGGSLTGLAWIAVTIPYAPGGLNGSDYYLISNVAAQLAIVSAMQT